MSTGITEAETEEQTEAAETALRVGVAITAMGLLAACGPNRSVEPSGGHLEPGPAREEAAAQRDGDRGIPPPVTDSPPLPPPSPPEEPARYTVVVNEVAVREILFALARDAGIDIDIVGDITGRVTLNAIDETLPRLLERAGTVVGAIDDVREISAPAKTAGTVLAVDETLPRLLERISLQAPIRYELREDYLRIAADEPYLESYPVPYVDITRDARSTVDTATQIGSTGFGEEGGGTGGAGAGGAGSNNSRTSLTNETDNRFWETLERNLEGVLNIEVTEGEGDGERQGRYVMLNREAGYITVRATQRQHREVQAYIDRVVASARRQVLIEATVVEVRLSDRYQAGVDWSVIANDATGLDIVQNLTGSSLGGAFNVPDPDSPGNPAVTIGYSDPDTQDSSLRSTIKLLDEFGDVQVMSSPKITALNNQLAILKVVDNRVYFTVDVQQTTDEGTTNTTFETEVNTVPVGLVMTVTPYIGQSSEVLLNVRPTVSRILGFRNDPNPELAAVGVENEIPEIQVREMESMLRVNSGQVAVIGGLIALTLLLIAGMDQFRHRIEHAQRGLTLLSAAILALMGIGFLAGVF